jgi:hypothetical protein
MLWLSITYEANQEWTFRWPQPFTLNYEGPYAHAFIIPGFLQAANCQVTGWRISAEPVYNETGLLKWPVDRLLMSITDLEVVILRHWP